MRCPCTLVGWNARGQIGAAGRAERLEAKALDRLWLGSRAWNAPLELRLPHADDAKAGLVSKWFLKLLMVSKPRLSNADS